MRPQRERKNIVAVRRLYEARGNSNIVKTVLPPDVSWKVVKGLPHSGIHKGLTGVSDFFTRLFGDFEDWHTQRAGIFEAGEPVVAIGFYSARAKVTGRTFKARFAHVSTIRDGVIKASICRWRSAALG